MAVLPAQGHPRALLFLLPPDFPLVTELRAIVLAFLRVGPLIAMMLLLTLLRCWDFAGSRVLRSVAGGDRAWRADARPGRPGASAAAHQVHSFVH